MGKKNKLSTSNSTTTSLVTSVGETLAKQREKLGMSAEECANALKIPVGKLADLEANNYASYSSEIFVRGHLKNYAKLVDLPSSDIIALYNESNPVKDAPVEPTMPISMKAKSHWWLPYSMVSGVLLVWLVVYQMMGTTSDVNHVVAPEAVADEDNAAGDVQAVPEDIAPKTTTVPVAELVPATGNIERTTITEVVAVPNQATSQALADTQAAQNTSVDIPLLASTVPAAELMKSTHTAVATVSTGAPVAPASAEQSDSLRFVFSEDCWLEVRNAAGKVVKSGLQRKGSSLSLEGEGPFKVTLGNAKGASLEFNNEPVALQTVANRRLLRVVVGG